MIAVRFNAAAQGVSKHFTTRVIEWQMTAALIIWGLRMLWGDEVFSTPAYVVLARLCSEEVWGLACLVVGLARFLALFVNGTFSDTWYSYYSPHVRAGMSFLTCFFWLTLSLAFFSSGATYVAGWMYLLFLCSEVWCSIRGAVDADRVNRNASP